MNIQKTAADLLDFISQSTSSFHTVTASETILKKAGFSELLPTKEWHLEKKHAYYTKIYDSSIIAFTINDKPLHNLRIAAAHTDFPCLRIKPAATIEKNKYISLNIEIYGGMILNTWLDRPLSIAGKVVLKSNNVFSPKVNLVDFRKPLLTIPNLAIHMNRKINEGISLNPQKDMLPLFSMTDSSKETNDLIIELLATETACSPEDILSYELTVYPAETGCLLGYNEEFISSHRLDNITSVKACLDGLLTGSRKQGINIIALFDNEEVGSRTKQGADSFILPHIIERIYDSLGFSHADYLTAIAGGFLLSADVAHALHPNVPEKTDPTNLPLLNHGTTIKIAASQSYANDAEAIGIIKSLCQKHDINYQLFVNRADTKGGSTLGSILSANMPMRSLDIGIPILAMHSARETMGINDQVSITKLIKHFFSE